MPEKISGKYGNVSIELIPYRGADNNRQVGDENLLLQRLRHTLPIVKLSINRFCGVNANN